MTYSPFYHFGVERSSQFICMCDHASNYIPAEICTDNLGLPNSEMRRHIAYDIGAAGLTTALAEELNGAAILSHFSRLLIDPNRGEDDPTLIMQLYDGTIIPGNRRLNEAERQRRKKTFYHPYHHAAAALIAARAQPIIVSIHSFTPQLSGRGKRPWHVGILYAEDRRLSDPLLARLQAESDICTGDNQPYRGDLEGDSMQRHGIRNAHPHVLIEIRNDLIDDAPSQRRWAVRLASLIRAAASDANLMKGA